MRLAKHHVCALGIAFSLSACCSALASPARGVRLPVGGRPAYRVAVHEVPGSAPLASALARRGFATALVTSEELSSGRLSTDAFDALLLPDARRCPISARDRILAFLRAGGDMLVVGGPLFEATVREAEARWEKALQDAPVVSRVITPDADPPASWTRGSDNPNSRTTWTYERTGPPNAPWALRMEIGDLTGWDTIAKRVQTPFPAGAQLTVFWAKGDARTTSLQLEWRERDGSRWIATVPLSTRWTRQVLPPDLFTYWPDSPSRGRGGPGDRFRPENAEYISVGLAMSHAAYSRGRHTFWLAGISSARLPEGVRPPDTSLPVLEMFTPWYKYYRLPSPNPPPGEHPQSVQLAATGNQDGPIVCPIPRPRGLALAGTHRWRWIPISNIRDARGAWRGTRESILVHTSGQYTGSVWGHIAAVQRSDALSASAARLLSRMREGVFLTRAGAEEFSYFTDEVVPIGAELANFGTGKRQVKLHLKVTRKGSEGALLQLSRTLILQPSQPILTQASWKPGRSSPGAYVVHARVTEGSRVLDMLQHEFSLLSDAPKPRSHYVQVRGGDFWAPDIVSRKRKPRRWYPYGVNYWQSNVAGSEPNEYWLHWLSPAWYDPLIVERDLAVLQGLGFNSVSIQLNTPDQVRQANDFIARAGRHGIRTNLFIAGAHPFYTNENLFSTLITKGRFARNPLVWAYDIAWEHHLGGHEERRRWDREWEQWIIERYGTVEHAEQNWGFSVPRDENGRITNPSDDQLRRDGPWLRMAAAYQRCADDVISRRYAKVIRKIRTLDPNHLISARSASQPSWTHWFAYDLVSCGKHFDFSSPEGYGLNPEEAGFTTAYARYAASGKPVFWAELGSSIYPYDATGEKARSQADLCAGFAKMLIDSGANGMAVWWSVGGYRVDERSDFGIIAPDGTPRPSAIALRKLAPRATSPRKAGSPSLWITVDRDLHAAGYTAVYEAHKRAYVDALRRGISVGVRTAGTGTTSANCPLISVGNVPYDGFSPLKYLNAEFYRVEVLNADGVWQEVANAGTVTVRAHQPVLARVWAGNTGDALWLSDGGVGAVRLVGDTRPDAYSSQAKRLGFSAPIPNNVRRHNDLRMGPFRICDEISEDCEVVLTFDAACRAKFGERFRIRLTVR